MQYVIVYIKMIFETLITRVKTITYTAQTEAKDIKGIFKQIYRNEIHKDKLQGTKKNTENLILCDKNPITLMCWRYGLYLSVTVDPLFLFSSFMRRMLLKKSSKFEIGIQHVYSGTCSSKEFLIRECNFCVKKSFHAHVHIASKLLHGYEGSKPLDNVIIRKKMFESK